MGFAADVRAFREKALKDANDGVAKVVTDLFKSIVALTPSPAMNMSSDGKAVYSRGLLVNQWYPAIKTFNASKGSAIDDNGTDSFMRIYAVLEQRPFYGKDNTVTLTNNISYAQKAEYLGWNYTAPYGMVRISLQNIKAKYT